MGERVEAVALDAMGVIYPVADDLRDLLIPYLRSKGCAVPDEAIIEAYRACYRGGASAETIWRVSGCDWQDGALERDYLACYTLNPGVVEFLASMRASSIPVYGLSNDVAEWAWPRRRLLGIDHQFAGWAISGEVGKPKPAAEIYRRLIEMLPCAPEACVFVDDRPANLEAAQAFGLKTTLFGPAPAAGFPAVAGFAELAKFILDGR